MGAVDALLAAVGLTHGRRQIRAGTPRARRQQPLDMVELPPTQLLAERHGEAELLVVPAWREAAIPHGFSTRPGGVSTAYRRDEGPGGEMNLGATQADVADNVHENRRRLLHAAGAPDRTLITLRQIHSGITRRIAREDAGRVLSADGAMTDDPALLLGVQTADCVPVLVRDRRTGAVAAFHAGWRGTGKRIVEGGIGRMRLEFGSRPEDLEAAVGPAIGPCCYAVGEEVLSEFTSQFGYAATLFSEVFDHDPIREKYPLLFLTQRAPGHSPMGPSLHLDLFEANRRQLLDAGLAARSIHMAYRCTRCEPDLFFSYRGEHGFCGRMMSVIGPPDARP